MTATTYAKGAVQPPLTEQVTQTKRKVTKAAPLASSTAGTIARNAAVLAPILPIRETIPAIRREQPLVGADRSSATSKTSSGVGVGIAPIAPSVIVEAHGATQSPVGSSSTVGDTLNIHSINLNDTERYPGWVRVLIVFALIVATWSGIYFIVTAALSLGSGS